MSEEFIVEKETTIKEIKKEFYTLTNAFFFKKNIKQNFTKLYEFVVIFNVISFLIMIFTFSGGTEENSVKLFWLVMTLLLSMVNIYHYYIASLSIEDLKDLNYVIKEAVKSQYHVEEVDKKELLEEREIWENDLYAWLNNKINKKQKITEHSFKKFLNHLVKVDEKRIETLRKEMLKHKKEMDQNYQFK